MEIPLEHVLPEGRTWDTLGFSHVIWNWDPILVLWKEKKPAPNRSLTVYQGVCITLIHFPKCTNDRKRCNCYHHLKGKILTDFFKHGTILLHSLRVIIIAFTRKNVFLLFILLLQRQHSYGRVHWILFWLMHQLNW